MQLDGCPASGPGVAGAAGTLHAAWWTGAEGRRGWWYARGDSPTSFDEPVRLDADYSITYAVRLAADASGQAWIAGMHWADAKAGYHLWIWRVAPSGQPNRLPDEPPVDAAAGGYDVTDVGDQALVAWIADGAVHVRDLAA